MFKSIVNLFFPKVCYACHHLLNDNEDAICTTCRHSLPVTNFHFNTNNTIKHVLYGRAKIENGTALFRFEKKSIVQQLIHNLKYRGHEHIGFVLGNWLGSELQTIPHYKNIDIVIPVPLHKKKLKTRGYNQVTKFGEQIARALDAKYIDDVLIKITNTTSQVNKKRLGRWYDNKTLFTTQNTASVNNKHILLVDDIITTGATIEACISALNTSQNITISVAVMAIA
ncbi:phosphoribosyltransferase family protein [uncultured Algibacter sp.]|uniref:ComF family protein n=1 Tax=uncultured Algibacter sp. TaxID=298659 RepID=UPI00321709C5